MLLAKLLVVTLWLSLNNLHFKAYGDASGYSMPSSPTACGNTPCQQVSPPLTGDPSYGAQPPPSGYSIYGGPPPPHEAGQSSKCPPAAGVQCCTPPAPPYYTYGYAPPYPYPNYAPPNPYTYVPYGGAEPEASPSVLLPILVPLVVLSTSFNFPL